MSESNGVKAYRILVADDHAVVRKGLRRLIESQPGLEVSGEAATGIETIEHVRKARPDLVVLDLTMPEMDGFEAAREIREISPKTGILVLSMHFSEAFAREALRVGARGYILKTDADSELLTAIDRIRNGTPFLTSRLALATTDYLLGEKASNVPHLSDYPLTDREVEIVQLLCAGKSNKQVAGALGISTRTVESHRNHIMQKMSFSNFSDLIRFAIRNDLIES
jgi:DNA-binding NarL/FixJ family response regulator